MGDYLKEHDVQIGSMQDQLNLRFAPSQGLDTNYGGIDEMVALQKEFKVFKKGRSFRTSVAVLGIGSSNGNEAKNRLYAYFASLSKHTSTLSGLDGDTAIVNTLIKNLEAKKPLPVYFTAHDMRGEAANARVQITPAARPLPYFADEYLVISLPTKPATPGKPSKKSKSKS